MSPLALLLRRDLRLNTDLLLLPLGAILLGGLIGLRHGPTGWAFSIFVILLCPLLAQAAHLREETHGTLGELRALPVSPLQLASLRLLQAAAAPLAGFLLASLLALPLQGPGAALRMGREASWTLAWLVLLLGAAPLPLTLRFGRKGWIGLILGVGALGTSFFLLRLVPESPAIRFIRTLTALEDGFRWLGAHPATHAAFLLAAGLAFLGLSTLAYRRRSL